MSDVILATLHLRSQAGLAHCRNHMAQFAGQAGIGRGNLTRAVTAVSEITRSALLVYGGEATARFVMRSAGDRRCLVLDLEGVPPASAPTGMPHLPTVLDAVRRLLDSAVLETRPGGRQAVVLEVRLPNGASLGPPKGQRREPLPSGDGNAGASALAAARAATWTWHPASNRVVLDPLGLALLGLAPGEFGGTLQALADCLHPADGPVLGEALERAEDDLCRIVRMVRGDGELRDIEVRGGRLEDGSGLGGLLIDVTERLASQRAHDDRQRQKLEMMGELAGAMAHEINNLLQPVIGVAGMLREDLADVGPLAADLDIIVDSARKAASILRDVLTFARPSDGARLAPRRLSEAVQDGARFLRSLLPPSIHLRVDLPADLADTVMLGGTSIQQILTNLVTNAAQAMNQAGTVSIVIAAAGVNDEDAETLEVPSGDYVRLSVQDTGCGMDAAIRSMMFEPFFTTKPAGQGTGLGLSVVFGIVRNMGGAIAVDSAPGAGCTISVYLPRVDDCCRVRA